MKLKQVWQIGILRKINKSKIDQDRLFLFLAFLTGIGSALVATGLHFATNALSHFFQTDRAFSWQAFFWGLGAIGLSGYLTTRHYPWSSGSGIPQTKIALVVYHGVIKVRDTMAKLLTTILSLSTGFSLGREGPTIAISAGIGSMFGNIFAMNKKRVKTLLASGASSGIAAAFNTPIAAMVFTLEEVVGNLNTKALGPILIATVSAAVVATAIHGSAPAFSVSTYQAKGEAELVIYFVVGILTGLLGPVWVKSILKTRLWNKKIFHGHRLTTIVAIFCIVALFSHLNPMTLGGGHHIIEQALQSEISGWELIVQLLILKFILTSLCYSTGISGGVFMPTLFIGAMCGSLVGSIAAFLFPAYTSAIGSYALVGMGAFFVAVIRAPLTSIIMIYEMTHDWKIIVPLMVANTTSFFIAKRLQKGSIYENISEQDGIHLPSREDYEVLDDLAVENAMVKDILSLDANMTVKEAMKKVYHSEISGYPVIKNKRLVGVISSSEIGTAYARYQGQALIGDVCTKDTINIYPDQSLMVAFHKLNKYKISRLLVVSRINDRNLVGIITAEDIVVKFGHHIEEESKADVLDKYMKDL